MNQSKNHEGSSRSVETQALSTYMQTVIDASSRLERATQVQFPDLRQLPDIATDTNTEKPVDSVSADNVVDFVQRARGEVDSAFDNLDRAA